MATILNGPGGRKRVQFLTLDGSRRSIRLGRVDLATAQRVGGYIDALVASKLAGQALPRDVASWVGGLQDPLRSRLAELGLIEAPRRETLGNFLEDFIATRKPTAAPNTIKSMEQVKRHLLNHFGPDAPLARITPADAERWAAGLATKYSPATVGRAVKRARQFFRAALRHKLIAENPFADVKAGSGQPDKDRQRFIPREVIARVLEAAPDAEWRLLIALSRYGGLRCPSEHLALKWSDVDWARNRFRVDSPKTGERWVPIFPELRPHLEEAFELAQPGAVYVITRYRQSNVNLRTQFLRIIRRAGVSPWPKLFHNLRASRETELAAVFPIHVVCAWIGNTAAIAARHYLTVREEDFTRASGAKNVSRSVQNPCLQGNAEDCTQAQALPEGLEAYKVTPLGADPCNLSQCEQMSLVGIEHPANSTWKTPKFKEACAENVSPGLGDIIRAWPSLPEDIQAVILGMVRGWLRDSP